MKRKKCKKIVQKFIYTFLAIVTFFSQANFSYMVYALADSVNYDAISVSDPDTSTIENSFNNSLSDDGKVVTDKSVNHIEEDLFEITLSALGQAFETSRNVVNNKKLDVVFVLDVSGSMNQRGTRRYISMVEAVNSAMKTIMNANKENRIGIVTFSDSSSTLLSLDSYSSSNQNGDYLTASDGRVSIANGVTDSNGNTERGRVSVTGGTYTQSGMARGANLLINNSDTTDRVPVIILLSDGEPTYATANYSNVGTAEIGRGYTYDITGDMGYYTILTGKSYKDKVESNYQTDCMYYTIGMDVTSNFGKTVLDPSDANINNLASNWRDSLYIAEFSLKASLNNYRGDFQYVDKSYSGQMTSDDLKEIFDEITSDIVKSFVSPLTATSLVQFTDTLGNGMEVKGNPTIVYNGFTYSSTSVVLEDTYTKYVFDHTVTNSNGEEVNLSSIDLRVYHHADGTETVSFDIPDSIFPYLTRGKDNTNISPIRLKFQVGLTDEAVANAKTEDVFYTNNFSDEKTNVVYTPAKDNSYYYENISYGADGTIYSSAKYKNQSLSKSENITNTNGNYYETIFDQGILTTILGNNGKVVLEDPNVVVSKTVTKVWQDADDQDGIRPESIEVELLANGEKTGKTATLNEDNHWTYEFTNLKKYTNNREISYTVREISKVDGYTTTYSSDGLTITNTHEVEKTSHIVTKVWDDNNNQDNVRPKSIEVKLYANGVATDKMATLNEENDWTYTFTDLDKNSDGVEIVYTADEVETVSGYTKEVATDKEKTTITNTHETDKVAKTVTKVWEDNNNQDGIRPTSISVELLADGKETGRSVVLSEENSWRYTFENLDKNSNGKEIKYTVKEITQVEGYTTTYGDDGLTITNTHTPAVRNITVVKSWDDANNQDGKRPDSIVVTLYGNGQEKASETLNEANHWSYTFRGLDVNANGDEIDYTVRESVVDGYRLTNTTFVHDTITLTNSYTPEETSKTVIKVWKDNENQDNLRPSSIEVELLADGVAVRTVTLSDANRWKYTFEGLDKYKNGNIIHYTVNEITQVEGYTTTYDQENLTITNTHDTYTTSKTVTKVWEDENNLEGFRPSSIEVELLANGEVVKPVTLSDANHWSYTFEGLDVNANGKEITYTVREKDVLSGYQVSYDQNTLTITNTKEVTRVDKTITKVWKDNNNQDGIRPESVRVTLYANQSVVGTYSLTRENGYSFTVSDLPIYANGEEITYTISEESVFGYTANYDQNTLTVTNTHIPAVRDIHISKEWVDANNQDGIRPGSVTIYVMANGVKVSEVVLSDANHWNDTVSNLPVYENGKEINYTLLEADIAHGYHVDYEYQGNDFKVVNTHEVEKTSITAEKIWNDLNNKDGLRTDEILVQLLANGEFYQTIRLNTANDFKATINNLDKFMNGTEILYTLAEISQIAGYETTYSSDTFTIVNNHRILTVTKTVDKTTANPGDTLTYIITVSNDGDVEANDIVLVDTLDTNLEFVSSEGGVYDASTHTVTYFIDSLNSEEKRVFTLITKIKEDVDCDMVIHNTALVLGNDNDEEVPSNEVTTTVVDPPKDEVGEIVNPDTSDNIYLLFFTGFIDMLLFGFFVKRKRENN